MTTNAYVRQVLESRLENLYGELDEIVTAYWTEVLEMEKKMGGGKNRNKLRLRGVKENNIMRADWVGIEWTGKTKEGKLFDKKVHITKPADSFSYTLSKLYKFAHEWEKELVEKTESKLSGIRQEGHHLTRALLSIGFAEVAEAKRRAKAEKV